jgi:hydrogenase maturation protease
MTDLRQTLRKSLRGRVCVIGVGNADQSDDGFGVSLAGRFIARQACPIASENSQNLTERSSAGFSVVMAGNRPEDYVRQLAEARFDHVLFLDAVEFGGAPGSVVFLSGEEMAARLPQVSTHKISLGLLANLIESNGTTRVWLLGVQPESIQQGRGLSPAVQATLKVLADLLEETLGASPREQAAPVQQAFPRPSGDGPVIPHLEEVPC